MFFVSMKNQKSKLRRKLAKSVLIQIVRKETTLDSLTQYCSFTYSMLNSLPAFDCIEH